MDTDDCLDTTADVLGRNVHKPQQVSPPAGHVVALSSGEADQVRDFIRVFQQNGGVLHLLGEWCMMLAGQALSKWLVKMIVQTKF